MITIGADLEGAAASQALRSARLRLCLKELTPIDEITVSWDGEELTGEFDSATCSGDMAAVGGHTFLGCRLSKPRQSTKAG